MHSIIHTMYPKNKSETIHHFDDMGSKNFVDRNKKAMLIWDILFLNI